MFNIRIYILLFTILSLFSHTYATSIYRLEPGKNYEAMILYGGDLLRVNGSRYLCPGLQRKIKINSINTTSDKVKFRISKVTDNRTAFTEYEISEFLFGDKKALHNLELVYIKDQQHNNRLLNPKHPGSHKAPRGHSSRSSPSIPSIHIHIHSYHRQMIDQRRGISSGDVYNSLRPWMNFAYSNITHKNIEDIGDSSSANKAFGCGVENDLNTSALIGLAFIHSWNDYDDDSKSYDNSLSLYGKAFLSDTFFLESDVSYSKGYEKHSGESKIELSNSSFEYSIGSGYEIKMSEHGFITPILSLIKSNHTINEKEIDSIKYGNVINDMLSANFKINFIYNIVRENVSIMPKFSIGGNMILNQVTSDPVNQIAGKHIVTNKALDLPGKVLEINFGSEIKSEIYNFDFDIHAYAGENYRNYGGSLKFAVNF